MSVTFTLNGKSQTVDVDPQMPLLRAAVSITRIVRVAAVLVERPGRRRYNRSAYSLGNQRRKLSK